MIPELYEHQKQVIQADPKWAPIAFGTGCAKTRTVLEMARGKTIVVCEKQQREDRTWQKNREQFDIILDLAILSKEEFRTHARSLPCCDTLILEEGHNFLGVYPETRTRNHVEVPKTSQLYEETLAYIRRVKPSRLYIVSATMISKPMNLYAAATLLGKNWDFYKFRSRFYVPIKMGYRTQWIAKKDKESEELLIKLFKENLGAWTGRLCDFFDVPPETFITKHFELTKEQKEAIAEIEMSEADPMLKRTKRRSIENGILYEYEVESVGKEDTMKRTTKIFKSAKNDAIIELAEEFPKLLIFANYIGQVDEIVRILKKEGHKNVWALTSRSKDRGGMDARFDAADKAIIVAQAGISAGYELKTCPCTVWASHSNRALHRIQGMGRMIRSDAIKAAIYIDLVVKGGLDEQCFDSVSKGVDFNEKLMAV